MTLNRRPHRQLLEESLILLHHQTHAAGGASVLDLIAGFEDPPHQAHTKRQEPADHQEAPGDSNVRLLKEAPAKSTDQVDHGVEQRNRLPERREHADGVKAAAKKGERGDHKQRDHLKLLKPVRPDPYYKAQ